MHAATPWRITLLGGLSATQGNNVVSRFRSQKIGALLAYLALFPHRTHTREELADLFWPDAEPEAARTNLRTALSSLRHQLEPPGAPPGSVIVARGRSEVALDPSAFATDVAAFDRAVAAAARPTALPEERARLLAEAAGLYQGPLLPGFYETWALAERDRLAEQYLRAVQALAAHHEEEGDFETALHWARRAVSADPLSEQAHADVIRLLMASGQESAARRQFGELEQLLEKELGDAPSPETRALLAKRPASRRSAAPAANFATASVAAPEPPLHLPLTLTRFFGRAEEKTRISRALCAEGARLLTLTGPGGSGKTRLAIETARQIGEHFRGGVWFVGLADLRDASRLFDVIAEAMALPRAPVVRTEEQVVEGLNARAAPVLLVLDNFEQLVDAGAPLVQTLLARAPALSCLVTSRRRLLLEGEQEFPVSPLATPGQPGTPERLMEFPSVQLFVNRAQAARPDFQLNGRNAPAVTDLCARLEGIPLALELAAAWSQTLTPGQMRERLARRFDLLVARRRDAPGRHATLRATMEWSWGLLPGDLQRFFAQLSVFRGGWTLSAAEAVTGEPDAVAFLAELRERSLLLAREEPAEAGLRFHMLETLREFADEQIRDPGERAALLARHYGYFLQVAEETEPLLCGPEQGAWLRRLEAEHDNFRAALAGALENAGSRGDALRLDAVRLDALRLAGALGWFWTKRSHFREGRRWLEGALAATENLPASPARARALRMSGVLAYWQADYAATHRLFEESLTLAEALGSDRERAFAHFGLAITAMNQGDVAQTLAHAQESLAAAATTGDPWLMARPRIPLSQVALLQNDAEAAQGHVERFLALMRPTGDRWEIAIGLTTRGILLRFLDRPEAAEACFREGVALSRDLDDAQGIVFGLWGLAGVAAAEDQPERAARLFGAAKRLAEAAHLVTLSIWQGLIDGDLARVRGALSEAALGSAWAEGRALTLEQAIAYALEASPPWEQGRTGA